jgi:hypothetical protein
VVSLFEGNVLRVGLAGSLTFLSYEKLARIKDYALNEKDIHFVVFEFGMLQNLDVGG